ncbi:MAG: hypothetical protein M1819_006825 [Sarea resinae]|nr:MAG: hypothetical protein M1819_006825 [Sarea resinae]
MASTTTTIPRGLRKGNTIAFVSPSARLKHELPAPLARAKAYLEKSGYRVRIIFNDSPCENFRESVLQRCEELHSAFRDPDIKAILCTVGGSSANDLIRHRDYKLIRATSKIFCGYSDITVLHYAIFTLAGLRTFYGPAAMTELGDYPEPLQFTTDHFWHVLEARSAGKAFGTLPRSSAWAETLPDFGPDEAIQKSSELSPSLPWTWLRPGKAKGRLFGGCLPSFLRLTGTKFWPDHRGRILLLENPMGEQMTDPLPLVKTRAMMADLANAGIFEEISGLVVGRPFAYDEKLREEFAQMITDQCYGTDFPILPNVDVGHTDPVLTVPLDAVVVLDSDRDEFSILEAGVL